MSSFFGAWGFLFFLNVVSDDVSFCVLVSALGADHEERGKSMKSVIEDFVEIGMIIVARAASKRPFFILIAEGLVGASISRSKEDGGVFTRVSFVVEGVV